MKVLTTIAVLSLLVASGCCLNADSCTDLWEQDAAVDAPVVFDGGGDDKGADGPKMSMPDGGADMGVPDAMVDAYVPDAMPECASSMSCAVERPFCDKAIAGGSCRACKVDNECADRADGKVRCNNAAPLVGQCGECNVNSECGDAKPVCQAHVCKPCVQDSECGGPGICLTQAGGRCAKDSEVLYVDRSNPKCTVVKVGGGTVDKPFCGPQLAVDAINNNQRIVALIGTSSLERVRINLPANESITLIGKGPLGFGPQIDPGSSGPPGILIEQGIVYLRGVVVKGGYGTGVLATGTASELNMTRCLVQGNKGGGILLEKGAAFEISNTIVNANGGDDVLWGGINVSSGGMQSKKSVLRNVTIVDNYDLQGLACDASLSAASGIISYKLGLKSIQSKCSAEICCDKAAFGTDLKLKSAATECIGKSPQSPAWDRFDVYGQLRDAAEDCGADELDLP